MEPWDRSRLYDIDMPSEQYDGWMNGMRDLQDSFYTHATAPEKPSIFVVLLKMPETYRAATGGKLSLK